MNESQIITSRRAAIIDLALSLREKSGRSEHDLCFAEGAVAADYALKIKSAIKGVLLSQEATPKCAELAKKFSSSSVPFYILTKECFEKISVLKNPEGLALLVEPAKLLSKPSELPKDGPVACLWQLQDPGNLGTIIRTADASGFDGILLSPDCADLFSPKVLRSTMGSVFRLGFSFPSSLPDALESLKNKGFSILSSQLDGDPFYDRTNVSPSFVLIIGNEGNGVSDAVKNTATHRLCLPMRGGAESLNAAVAAGIMMYDLMR